MKWKLIISLFLLFQILVCVLCIINIIDVVNRTVLLRGSLSSDLAPVIFLTTFVSKHDIRA